MAAAAVLPALLALLYCAGLFSNSFIEVGDEILELENILTGSVISKI